MSVDRADVRLLMAEYRTFVEETSVPREKINPEINWDSLINTLSESGDWTSEGAVEVVNLARSYGSFVLRNAFALAAALDLEDGDLAY